MPRKRGRHQKVMVGVPEQIRRPVATAEGHRRRAFFEALAEVGEVIYVIRCPDGLIKIGHTTNLRDRRRQFDSDPRAILAVVPGTYEEEQAIHDGLRDFCARGREFYYPAPEILAFVNDIREQAGVPPIAA